MQRFVHFTFVRILLTLNATHFCLQVCVNWDHSKPNFYSFYGYLHILLLYIYIFIYPASLIGYMSSELNANEASDQIRRG